MVQVTWCNSGHEEGRLLDNMNRGPEAHQYWSDNGAQWLDNRREWGGMLIQIWVAINSVAGRSTTGNVGQRLLKRVVCFDQRLGARWILSVKAKIRFRSWFIVTVGNLSQDVRKILKFQCPSYLFRSISLPCHSFRSLLSILSTIYPHYSPLYRHIFFTINTKLLLQILDVPVKAGELHLKYIWKLGKLTMEIF